MLWKSHTLQIYQFLGKTPEMLFLYFELYGARILNLCDVKCLCIYTPVRAMFVHVHTSQCYVCASTHQSVLCLCIYTPVSAMFVHLHTSQCYVCASTHQSVLCLCIYTPVSAMFVHLHTSQCYICASTHQSVLCLCIYTPVSAMFVHLHTSQCCFLARRIFLHVSAVSVHFTQNPVVRKFRSCSLSQVNVLLALDKDMAHKLAINFPSTILFRRRILTL